jgi:hypothetical protein
VIAKHIAVKGLARFFHCRDKLSLNNILNIARDLVLRFAQAMPRCSTG